MAYVITQNCCKDGSCVPVCPVSCIRPAGSPGEFTGTEMLYIDPDACIDCGACLEECPVDAIFYDEDLPPDQERFREINARFFERHPLQIHSQETPLERHGVKPGALRVAVVGAGPAACYASTALIGVDGVEVNLFERLPTPFGLIRAGVAPDHQHTKSVVRIFDHTFTNKRFECYLNVEIGSDLTHDELLAHHHAVIYAVGASRSRELDLPGNELPGNHSAVDFVGWYNGHPDHAHHVFDLSGERAVIIGNGNVALDVARVLLLDTDHLATTDIAPYALAALSDSRIREVVVLARRGPRDAAFSTGEFLALGHLPGVDVIIDSTDLATRPDDDVETVLKLQIAREYADRPSTAANKRVVFRFAASPTEVVGSDRAEGLRVATNGSPESELLTARTDTARHRISRIGDRFAAFRRSKRRGSQRRRRVIDEHGQPVPGVYVTGGSNADRVASSAPTETARKKRSPPCWRTFIPASWPPMWLTPRRQATAQRARIVTDRMGRLASIDAAERRRGARCPGPA
ncbi:4Fe-4S ferredoxin [Mycolicibacterium fortuitum]|uniref:ferredoxin--NADP(+) reductase n=1 Tax=Mycolicibacterium fortuitum TaxID=1766 RepID=A0A378U4U8_MYCFO|nr:4Fe-4S ferredoxin [Mycolicibacterium fortuitum]